jgi:transposase
VLDWLAKQSPYVSQETLETYLETTYGVSDSSMRSYYELLEQAGLSYKKRQAVNPSKNEQQVLQRREKLEKSKPTGGRN